MTEYLKVQSTMNKSNNVMKLLTSHVEWICYAYHMELQSKDTPWLVEHQDETPMVSADPNDCPDLVAPGLTAILETHIDSNMFHHSFKNEQIDDKVYWCFSDRASWIDYTLITNFCALIIIYS